MAEHIVVGTAGHVDHGKTSLVEALTGVECDRLPEEKARGITIELGYAPWTISDALSASIVDVPGHERFVRTMVAGATGIDCVLLVVAADEGVMPQTREHLEICELLGVKAGVVVLTKCDLAADDLIELAADDVRAATRGTFLEAAEIVRCSARDRRGLDALPLAVARASRGAAARRGPAFLPIDRVFTRPGAGTVVTGTLVRGAVRVGDTVDVSPIARGASAALRVRALQVHGRAAPEARAATRVALNLHGDATEEIRRGAVVSATDSAVLTSDVLARLERIRAPIERRTELRLHLGTTAVAVAVMPVDPTAGLVRLRSREVFATFTGQRFVLRRSGRHGEETIGGGAVCDPAPPRKVERPFFFDALDAKGRVERLVREASYAGISADTVVRRCPAGDDVVGHLREHAVADGRYYAREIVDEAKAAALDLVRAFHEDKPLLAGISSAELVTRAPARLRAVVALAIEQLVSAGALRVDGGLLHAKATSAAANAVLERILEHYRAAGLAPPQDDVVRDAVALSPTVFREALGELKRASALCAVGGFHFTPAALASLRDEVGRHFQTQATLTPGHIKELCGITRRHAVPLLEWLDREALTIRRGDARLPGPRLAR